MTPSPRPSPSKQSRLVRLGVPPAVSLAVHGLLLALIVVLGVRVEQGIADRPRLGEVEITSDTPAPSPTRTESLVAPTPQIRPARPAPPIPTFKLPAQPSTQSTPVISALPASTLPGLAPSLTDPESARVPTASFAGLRAHAAGRIVYVVDASGAVVPTLTYIKRRLAQSIDRLAPTQRFEIIFFREPAEGASSVEPRPRFAGGAGGANRLTRATPQARADAAAWIDTIHGVGRSDPAAALREALALKPDLIFLLSTSIQRTQTDDVTRRARLLEQLDRLNPPDPRTGLRPVVIKALQFLRPDPANLLREISMLHGDGEGSYRLLTATQLDAGNPHDPQEPESTIHPPRPVTTQGAEMLQALEPDAWTVVLGLSTRREREQLHAGASGVLNTLERASEEPRDTRWSVLVQRAGMFLAAAEESGSRLEAMRLAASTPVRGVLADPGSDLERRLVLALTESFAGLEPTEPLIAIEQEARDNAYPWIELRASLGRALTGSNTQAPPKVPDDPRLRVLVAEARTRARLESADPSAAFEPVLSLLADESLHPSVSVREQIVWSKLAAADQMFQIDWTTAPAPATLGFGAWLTRQPETRDRGLGVLAHLAASEDASDNDRAAALWHSAIGERALAETDPEARQRVSLRLQELVTRFPGTAHARDAAAAAIALGASDEGVLSDDTPSGFISLALTLFPTHPGTDRWRLGLAHRASGLDRITLLESIPVGSPEEPLAAELVWDTAFGLLTPEILEAALAYTHRRGLRAWFGLAMQLADELSSPANRLDIPLSPDAAARAAELYLAIAMDPNHEGSPDTNELRYRAGASLARGAGSDPSLASGAVAILTELGAELEPDRSPMFWSTWATILEILEAHGEDPATRSGGAAHFARLQLLDPQLGGEPWATRLRHAADSLDSP